MSIGFLRRRVERRRAQMGPPDRCARVMLNLAWRDPAPMTVEALADISAIPRAWVAFTLGELAACELVQQSGDGYRLTERGRHEAEHGCRWTV